MNSIEYLIKFSDVKYKPIKLPQHSHLSEHLTVTNSPVLFGCRTGICGTCIVAIKGKISPPQADEKELLEILAPDNPQARLACQIDLTSDIEISEI
ncbi:2Fe-2S iron-sulfur cluster-binding protein [Merismopedia glauca]|uniref:Ferredoxin n=1 Tax=Merismopedia glauca CCAP 1448/3 TaxID=1296344 RepID=A0A2T1C518_9CYAN|nr:2Fe-2S iron-sulfur cluster-binding protein [Merismopedia glauca]PSB03237.1 ferredoxin [Merismopedia glauca CCAP 1448/3]